MLKQKEENFCDCASPSWTMLDALKRQQSGAGVQISGKYLPSVNTLQAPTQPQRQNLK